MRATVTVTSDGNVVSCQGNCAPKDSYVLLGIAMAQIMDKYLKGMVIEQPVPGLGAEAPGRTMLTGRRVDEVT